LLNALLGEEIQPVRAIPCSGTVTVLRHGATRRVIARYRDGREEEIPFEQYQEKAAISEDAALSNRDDALNSDLLELVLEHPGLALCQQGVELVDSPGLNEHPDRTRLTHQLLENVDAVIFLANASRPLTQGERELLQELRLRLNGGDASHPAENLFVVVNFMDLLRREKDQQQVKQLFENFLFGEAAIITSEEQLHFISAQSAVDKVNEPDHVLSQSFASFKQALCNFLVQGHGKFQYEADIIEVNRYFQRLDESVQQHKSFLQGDIEISQDEQLKVLELIGEISGIEQKLCTMITAHHSESLEATQGLLLGFAYKDKGLETCSHFLLNIIQDTAPGREYILARFSEFLQENNEINDDVAQAILNLLSDEISIEELKENLLYLAFTELELELDSKSEAWITKKTNQVEITRDFSSNLQADASETIERWWKEDIFQAEIQDRLQEIDLCIRKAQESIRDSSCFLDKKIDGITEHYFSENSQQSLSSNMDMSVRHGEQANCLDAMFGGSLGLGTGGVLAGGAALAVSSIAFFPVILTGASILGITAAGAAIGSSVGALFGLCPSLDIEKIRGDVLYDGIQQILSEENYQNLEQSIEAKILSLYEPRVEYIRSFCRAHIENLDTLISSRAEVLKLDRIEVSNEIYWIQIQEKTLWEIQKSLPSL
jgi:Dynamin family